MKSVCLEESDLFKKNYLKEEGSKWIVGKSLCCEE